jgi:hypothetical protein
MRAASTLTRCVLAATPAGEKLLVAARLSSTPSLFLKCTCPADVWTALAHDSRHPQGPARLAAKGMYSTPFASNAQQRPRENAAGGAGGGGGGGGGGAGNGVQARPPVADVEDDAGRETAI